MGARSDAMKADLILPSQVISVTGDPENDAVLATARLG